LDSFPILGSLKKEWASCVAFFGNTKLKKLMYNPMDLTIKKLMNFFILKKSPDVYRDLNDFRI